MAARGVRVERNRLGRNRGSDLNNCLGAGFQAKPVSP
jgi:hypothetical protein